MTPLRIAILMLFLGGALAACGDDDFSADASGGSNADLSVVLDGGETTD
jgi:hypothetical protein